MVYEWRENTMWWKQYVKANQCIQIRERLNFIYKSKEIKIKERAKPKSIYTEWLKYLKKKKLFSKYQIMVIHYLQHVEHRNEGDMSWTWKFSPILYPGTLNGIREVVNIIDKMCNNDFGYPYHYWNSILADFEYELDGEHRRSVLARRLYHMDAPVVKHNTYVTSVRPRTHWVDKLIDKIFFIKR
jgi:hypothetical protein